MALQKITETVDSNGLLHLSNVLSAQTGLPLTYTEDDTITTDAGCDGVFIRKYNGVYVKLDLTDGIPVDEFKKDTDLSDSECIQRAVAVSLTAQKAQGRSGVTVQTLELKFQPRQYTIKSTINIDVNTPANAANADKVILSIKGASRQGVTLMIAPECTTVFNIIDGTVDFVGGMRAIGHGTATFLTTGTSNQNVPFKVQSQSRFERLQLYYFNKGINSSIFFDSAFYDCGFFGFSGTNPSGVNFTPDSVDNINNIHFFRCHWEKMKGGTFIKINGNADTAAGRHSSIGFWGCHFETQYFNSAWLDINAALNILFKGCQFTQNNGDGLTDGVTISDVVPVVKLKRAQVSFEQCNMTINASGMPGNLPKMFELASKNSGVSFKDCFISNGRSAGNPGINTLWQSSTTDPAQLTLKDWAVFENTYINDIYLAPSSNSFSSVSNPDIKNRKWSWFYNTVADTLDWFYENSDQTKGIGTGLISFLKEGYINAIRFVSSGLIRSNSGFGNRIDPAFSFHALAEGDNLLNGTFRSDYYGTNLGTSGRFTTYRANGTAAVKSTLLSNQFLGLFGSSGYDGAVDASNVAYLAFRAAEDWSATAHGTKAILVLNAAGTTSPAERYTFLYNRFGLFNTNPQYEFDLTGTARVSKLLLNTVPDTADTASLALFRNSVTGVLEQKNIKAVASANSASAAAGTAPTKAEFDALLNELRDLKTKMQAAGTLA